MAAPKDPQTAVDRRAVRPAEAAAMLGCARSTIYELLDAGELVSYRIGRCRFVPVASIDEFIARRVADSAA